MKQVVQDARSGEIRVLDVPVPAVGPGLALVRTRASLVSPGTERAAGEFAAKSLLGKARQRPDLVRQVLNKARLEGPLSALSAVQNRLSEPLAPGYASAGTVVQVGVGLASFQVGDRVACAGGGYAVHAEFALIPENLMARLPDQVDFGAGAFATLGAIAMHGFRLADVQLGARVAVVGLGLLGQLALGVAAASGCEVFGVDVDDGRVALARSRGFHAVLRAEAADAGITSTHGAGFDAVLICAATHDDDPVILAGDLARDRARIVAIGDVGLNIPRRVYYQKELNLIIARSYGPGRYDPSYEEAGHDYPIGYVRWTEGRNLASFLQLVAAGNMDVVSLITHRIPVAQAMDAYELIRERREPSLGVLLTYPPGDDEAAGRSTTVDLRSREVRRESAVRLGVLGAGHFATAIVFPNLGKIEGLDKVGLATSTGLSAAEAGRRYGFGYATTDEKEILADPDINTVAVLTRHHLHARQVTAGLQAGKHVFCEKPPALNRRELDGIVDALDGSECLFTVGYNRRFAPLAVALKDHFEPVGEPLMVHYRVNAGMVPKEHWVQDPAQGGGRLIGEGCHFIDFMTFLTDSLPLSVTASGVPASGRYQQDNLQIQIAFENGSIGSLLYVASGDRSMAKERVEVFAGGRSAVLDDFRQLTVYAAGRSQTQRARLRQDKGHLAIWVSFVSSITNSAAPPIPYDQIVATSMATFAALESLSTGRPVPVGGLSKD